jgi:hypothetical protein
MAKHEPEKIKVRWKGPYGWPNYEGENDLPRLPNVPGVYLWTFEYQGGYLIYNVGITHTKRPIPERIKDYTRQYRKGECNVLDVAAAQRGDREEIWRGWKLHRTRKRARRKRGGPDLELEDLEKKFAKDKEKILDAVREQLAGFRIFIVDDGDMRMKKRVRKRLEAAILNMLERQPSPFRDIPDKNQHREPRLVSTEPPIIVENECAALLHSLPACLEI